VPQGSTASKPARRGAWRSPASGITIESLRRALPELCLAALILGFIAVTVWWLGADQTPPDGDAGRHVNTAFSFKDQIAAGYFGYPFRFQAATGAIYPPLVYLVGALPLFLTGLNVDIAILGLNLVFVPMLALSCYGIGRRVYGNRWSGVLAAVFALATPVVIGQFHLFMLDIPLAALVAATTWALLAGDHFANRRLSLLAGVLVGLGLLAKQPFVVFVAPVAAVLVLRGGYRNWFNVGLFALVAAVIAVPWYLKHLPGLTRVTQEATTQGAGINPYGTSFQRWTPENYAWYWWTLADVHYFVPLTIFFAVGLVSAVVGWFRRRMPRYAPELVVGVLAGYVGVALVFGFQDARYSMPAVVFVAVLGGGWIATTRRAIRIPAVSLLLAVLVVNTLNVSAGTFGDADLRFAKQAKGSWLDPALTLISEKGYTGGPANESGRTLDILKAARKDGVEGFSFDSTPPTVSLLSPNGLFAFGRQADVAMVLPGSAVLSKPTGMFLSVRAVARGYPAPCTRFSDGSGLYIFRGGVGTADPIKDRRHLYCPPGVRDPLRAG
jgi:hypothetical protein